MHAFIVTGGTDTTRSHMIQSMLAERSVSPCDTIIIDPDPTAIGVQTIRIAAARVAIRPMAGPGHAVIVRHAHTMTTEAQNAFLKTIEEPPGNTVIVLETDQPDALLPTILSRCHLVRLQHPPASGEPLSANVAIMEQLITVPIGKRLQLIDTIAKTKSDALLFIDGAIASLHENLATHPQHATLLRALLTARRTIHGNITPKLALDRVFLPT